MRYRVHFPFLHDRQRQFQNAHKLFGVSNITKIIKNFNPPEKDIVMHTMVFQSDTQANDSVGGCYRIIQELPHQIEYSQAELELDFGCDSNLGYEMVKLDLLNLNYYYIQEPQEKQFVVDDHSNNNQHLLQETYDHLWGI
uniref:LOB domain-containing protein n=1 Tax=Gossypium raimondii TaxID=29730 RepID=A0A0D2RHE0_GOSRA|nr:hypothetical protein B456_003G058900 [Gossypium raimondii]